MIKKGQLLTAHNLNTAYLSKTNTNVQTILGPVVFDSPIGISSIIGDLDFTGNLTGGNVPWERLTNIPSDLISVTGDVGGTVSLNNGKFTINTSIAQGSINWSKLNGSTIPTASTSGAGIVQLSSSTNSTSTALAATASAVKSVYDLASGKADASHTHNASDINDGFIDRDRLHKADTNDPGIVQLVNSVSSNDTDKAATANAAKMANDNANSRVIKSGDTMTGRLSIVAGNSDTLHALTLRNSTYSGTQAVEMNMLITSTDTAGNRGLTITTRRTSSGGAETTFTVGRGSPGTVDLFYLNGPNQNIGINTTSPGSNYTLDINGNTNVTGKLYGHGKAVVNSSDGWLRLNPDEEFHSGVYTPGDLVVNEKLGVGVVTPDSEVHVDGRVEASQGFKTNNFEIVYNENTESLDFNVV